MGGASWRRGRKMQRSESDWGMWWDRGSDDDLDDDRDADAEYIEDMIFG